MQQYSGAVCGGPRDEQPYTGRGDVVLQRFPAKEDGRRLGVDRARGGRFG